MTEYKDPKTESDLQSDENQQPIQVINRNDSVGQLHTDQDEFTSAYDSIMEMTRKKPPVESSISLKSKYAKKKREYSLKPYAENQRNDNQRSFTVLEGEHMDSDPMLPVIKQKSIDSFLNVKAVDIKRGSSDARKSS